MRAYAHITLASSAITILDLLKMKAITLVAILSIVGSCYAALPIVTCQSTNSMCKITGALMVPA